jgi:hypothetical protein
MQHCRVDPGLPLSQAALMDVPFVDIVSTMSDPSLPLTVIEYQVRSQPVHGCLPAGRAHTLLPYSLQPFTQRPG